MTRLLSLLLVFVSIATAFMLGGCSTYKEVRADGTQIEVRSVGVPRSVYVAPDFGWDNRHYRGGDTRGYKLPYRIRPGEVCEGSYGTVHGGICYPEKPYGMR